MMSERYQRKLKEYSLGVTIFTAIIALKKEICLLSDRVYSPLFMLSCLVVFANSIKEKNDYVRTLVMLESELAKNSWREENNCQLLDGVSESFIVC